MKEYLCNQINEHNVRKSGERFSLYQSDKENNEKLSYSISREELENKMKRREQMNQFKQVLDEQIRSKPEEAYMNDNERKINKKVLDRISQQ
jgi:hypothetical protein